MSKILTVVMPSYNAESYLSETIPTILASKFVNDIELIIVNDGSKDNTLEIARNFEKKYPNSVRVIDKENGGHGSAINVGIEAARGKYFKIIDADDWVDTKTFSELLAYLKEVNVDQVVSPYTEVYVDSGKKIEKSFLDIKQGEFTYSDFLNKIGFIPQMHSLTILTSLLKDNKIKVDERMFYVDTQYIIYPMPFVNKVGYYGKSVYQYRLGTTTQSVNINNYIKNRNMLRYVILSLIKFYNDNHNKLNGVAKKLLDSHLKSLVSLMVNIYLSMSPKEGKAECLLFVNDVNKLTAGFTKDVKQTKVRLLEKTNYLLFGVLSFYTRKCIYKL